MKTEQIARIELLLELQDEMMNGEYTREQFNKLEEKIQLEFKKLDEIKERENEYR